MANYDAEIIGVPIIHEESLDDLGGVDLVWWFEEPPTPPDFLSIPKSTRIVQTLAGSEKFSHAIANLSGGGRVKYFKFGEGGWSPSDEITKSFFGNGTTRISGILDRFPISFLRETHNVVISGTDINGNEYHVHDRPMQPYNRLGTLRTPSWQVIGQINYKTGEFSFDWTHSIPSGTLLNASYRSWGKRKRFSADIDQIGGSGPFIATLPVVSIVPGTVDVTDCELQFLTDDGLGNLTGDGNGTIDYETGDITVNFSSPVRGGFPTRVTWIADGVSNNPNKRLLDLDAVTKGLFTYKKDFNPVTDMVFQGVGTGTVRITMTLDFGEANNDSFYESPYFSECGLFSEDGTMLCHFTFPRKQKNGSVVITQEIDLKRLVL